MASVTSECLTGVVSLSSVVSVVRGPVRRVGRYVGGKKKNSLIMI